MNNIEWKRKDQMNVKERKIFKEKFLQSLLTDNAHKWKYVIIDGIKTDYMICDDGRLASLRLCRDMKPSFNPSGYLETIIVVNGKRTNVSIHRLVAEAFIPNPDNLPEVNHKSGNKGDNSVNNLEWMTHQENIEHAINTGLRDIKVNRHYTKKDIHKVCELLEKGFSIKEIRKRTGVGKGVIRSIRSGKAWKKISKHYNIQRPINEEASTTIQSIEHYDEEFIYKWEM